MTCFDTGSPGGWDYGIYSYGVPLLQDPVSPEKIMYGLFFGMMTMATFGNALVPAPDAGQAVFSFLFVLCGLLLFIDADREHRGVPVGVHGAPRRDAHAAQGHGLVDAAPAAACRAPGARAAAGEAQLRGHTRDEGRTFF